MHLLIKAAAAAALICTSTIAAANVTVDFGNLPGANSDAFTGPYVEDGVTVTSTGGQVYEGHVEGNSQPSLVVGSVFGGGSIGVVQLTSPTLFQLVSWDQLAQNGQGGYTVRGYAGASLLYTLTGSIIPGSWTTLAGTAGNVDRLVFTLTTQGTSTNFDNVVLGAAAAVPEPGTWLMMIAGFGMIAFAMRRSRTKGLLKAA